MEMSNNHSGFCAELLDFAAPVPEPNSFILLGFGLLVVVLGKFKQDKVMKFFERQDLMDYGELYANLAQNPPPTWRVIYNGGALYLWPDAVPAIIEPPRIDTNSLLGQYSILFQFHVTPAGFARILARARFHAQPGDYANIDQRWHNWWNAARQSGAEDPENAPQTRSLALWCDPPLPRINFETPAAEAANYIREFLANPPQSLARFIETLR